jgi:hypothetical protein
MFEFYNCPLLGCAVVVDSDNALMSMGDCVILEIDEGKKDPLRAYRQMSSEKEKKREKENK